MKLYQSNLSNFATKTRIAIYDKGLKVDFVEPPGGLHSPEAPRRRSARSHEREGFYRFS